MKRFVRRGGGAAPRPPIRKMYCPVCASSVEENRRDRIVFTCGLGNGLENSTGHALRSAVYRVDPPHQPPRQAPELADYLWCPNCTTAMDEFDERGRELRCPGCGLSIPSVMQIELMEFKENHCRPGSDGWDDPSY